ncbi:hypothetical protein BFC18_20915 [Alteromonas confluentis]|uniref:histidine kinase n=1 Tax=Alteromonas confluentis TaxID=1656094 RepID=A0A1E7Z6T7_9ALTE|nr:hypothetical protein BFC18_20915 [Alteromonas confluentis]
MVKPEERPKILSMQEHYLEKELFHLLQHDKLMFEFFQNEVVDGLWYWDLTEPENEWMSPKFWRLFGFDPEFKLHKVSEWQDLIFPEDLALAQRNLQLHLRNPDIPYDQVVRYKHKNGSIVWVRCKGIAIHSEDGEPIRLLGCHQDLTRVMERQQELLGLQIRYDHLTRRFDALSEEVSRSRSMNEALNQQVQNDFDIDDVGFSGQQHFVEQTRLLTQNAHRLGLDVTVISVSVPSLNKDISRINELRIFLRDNLIPAVPGGIFHSFSDEFYGVLVIGFGDDDLTALHESVDKKSASFDWLTGKQKIALKARQMPVSEEMFNKFVDLPYILGLFFR